MTLNPSIEIETNEIKRRSADSCRVTIFDANAFDFDASPACTSTTMFRSSSPPTTCQTDEPHQYRAQYQPQVQLQEEDDAAARCPICVAPFVPNGAAVPKTLPCGHSFCAECIFSLCLHKEYYLLESIFCLKCGTPCDARRAMKAPVDTHSEYANSKKEDDTNSNENDNNVTVIHLTNTRGPSSSLRKRSVDQRPPVQRPILGTALMTPSTTPRRRVRTRRVVVSPPTLSPLPTEEEMCYGGNYGSDSCGTSTADYERIGGCYRSSSVHSHRLRGRAPSARSTEMDGELNSDYGSGFCAAATVASHTTNNASRWQAKFARRTHRIDAQLARARQIIRAAQLASEIEAEIEIASSAKDLSASVTVAVDGGYDDAPSGRVETSAHFQRYANVLGAYDEAKKILKREFTVALSDDLSEMRSLTRRLNILRQCLEKCRFDFEARRVSVSSFASAVDGVCACVEAICASLNTNDALDERVVALKKLARGMCASDGYRPHVGRALADTVRLLTGLLNEETFVETIPFFDLAFAFSLRALKRIVRATQRANATSDVNARQAKLWKMTQSAYSELLRVAGMHWSCADARRVALVASTAQMCALFAEVCDTATILLCIIEAARARVALANATTAAALAAESPTSNAVETAERSRAQFHLQRIDDHLLECRRVQKLAKLRSHTRLFNKMATISDGATAPATPAIVAAAVTSCLTPRKCAAVGNALADALPATVARKTQIGTLSSKAPAAHRRFPFWRRILPRRIFCSAAQ